MTNIDRSTDCGNSPKNRMVEDIGIALETRETEFLSTILNSDSEWGDSAGRMVSSEEILALLGEQEKPAALAIDHVMSHGKVGAVNGRTKNGNGDRRFCHVIEFTSTKCNSVHRIESYRG